MITRGRKIIWRFKFLFITLALSLLFLISWNQQTDSSVRNSPKRLTKIINPIEGKKPIRNKNIFSQNVSTSHNNITTLQNNVSFAQITTEVLACFTRPNHRRVYYSYETRECLPLPHGRAEKVGSMHYIPPSNPTLIPVLDALNVKEIKNTDDLMPPRTSPSVHSRWLFEEWRQWEGDVNCNLPPENDYTSKVQKKELIANKSTFLSSFVTRGFHNSALPNSVYQLEYFCVDEEEGRLIGFEYQDKVGKFQMRIDDFKGEHEHPHGGKWSSTERFFHPENRVVVNLAKVSKAFSKTNARHWKELLSTALGTRYGTLQRPTKTRFYADIQFVEDRALMVPLNAYENKNAAHQLHRYGSSAVLARLLNVTSLLFLMDLVAQKASDVLYVSRGHTSARLAEVGGPIALLPRYLQSKREAAVQKVPQGYNEGKKSSLTPALMPLVASPDDLPKPDVRPRDDYVTPDLFAKDALGLLHEPMAFSSLVSTLLSSGQSDCEETRCSEKPLCSVEAAALRRRCERPYATLLLGSMEPSDIRINGFSPNSRIVSYRADTQNYSNVVWNLAVKEAFRESKRIRSHLRNAKQGVPFHAWSAIADLTKLDPVLAKRYTYITVWRERLISLLANEFGEAATGTQPPASSVAITEYTNELFAVLLEVNYYLEKLQSQKIFDKQKGKNVGNTTSTRRPRKLMCYRKAFMTHVHMKSRSNDGGFNARGSFPQIFAPNCNSREAATAIYESSWARYGMCGSDSQSPQHNTNQDAHPIFTLSGNEVKRLRSLFKKSQDLINFSLSNATRLKTNLQEVRNQIYEAQFMYDSALMQYFLSPSETSKRTKGQQKATRSVTPGRPVALYWALRTVKRPTIHLSHHMSRLLNEPNGIGRYISFEFNEGLKGTAHDSGKDSGVENQHHDQEKHSSLTSPRARQFYNYQTSDLYIGPHGADMHGIVFAKPSAMVTEISYAPYDGGNKDFTAGYFSFLAYARNIGYLRVLGISRSYHKMPSDAFDRPMVPLALTELRQTLALSFCSWLAFNAVRRADEEKEKWRKGNVSTERDEADFSFLIPWWCRGGAQTLMGRVRRKLQKYKIVAEEKSSDGFDEYFKNRNRKSPFGFAIPNCSPFWPTINSAFEVEGKPVGSQWIKGANLTALTLAPSKVTRHTLNRLQNKCARPITSESFAKGKTALKFRDVEGLQGLLEDAVPPLSTKEALMLARLMVEGARNIGGFISKGDNKRCGIEPVDKECLERLVQVALTTNRAVLANSLDVSAAYIGLLPQSMPTFSNATIRDDVARWVAGKFYWVIHEQPRRAQTPILASDSFSYGHLKCNKVQ